MKRSEFSKYDDMMARALNSVGPDYAYQYMGVPGSNGHGSDKGKLPNHPTFSNESAFANAMNPGGQWIQTFQGTRFQPSMQQWMRPGYDQYIRSYMDEVEPNVSLDEAKRIPFSKIMGMMK